MTWEDSSTGENERLEEAAGSPIFDLVMELQTVSTLFIDDFCHSLAKQTSLFTICNNEALF